MSDKQDAIYSISMNRNKDILGARVMESNRMRCSIACTINKQCLMKFNCM
jgi:hypothetical protein